MRAVISPAKRLLSIAIVLSSAWLAAQPYSMPDAAATVDTPLFTAPQAAQETNTAAPAIRSRPTQVNPSALRQAGRSAGKSVALNLFANRSFTAVSDAVL